MDEFILQQQVAITISEPEGITRKDKYNQILSAALLYFRFYNKKRFSTENLFLERETGIEPATPSLARRCSTAEPLAHIMKF